jgi:hypothetical protein
MRLPPLAEDLRMVMLCVAAVMSTQLNFDFAMALELNTLAPVF